MPGNSEWIYTKDENRQAEWHLGIVARMERDFFESRRYFVQNYYNKVKKLVKPTLIVWKPCAGK